PNTSLAILRRIATLGWLHVARELRLAESFVQRLAIKTPSLDAPVSELSGGNQQKVALARWLATEPSILILDEPTQGVDVGAKAEIHAIINRLADRGVAVLIISSELPEVLALSDRIVVIRDGSIAGVLARDEASADRVMELAVPQSRND